jgi:amino acid transporter
MTVPFIFCASITAISAIISLGFSIAAALENFLVIFVAILLLTSHCLQFSTASCVFIALFILVHILGAHQLGWRVATKTLETTKKKRMRPQKLLNLRFREEVFLLLINGFLTPDNRAHHQHIRRR